MIGNGVSVPVGKWIGSRLNGISNHELGNRTKTRGVVRLDLSLDISQGDPHMKKLLVRVPHTSVEKRDSNNQE
jgi:hypothetical protein